jgi:spermidine synthase
VNVSPYPDRVRKIVLIVILISGFTSLAYEVIWTRQLILFLATSIYAFSGMLAVFLTGIAAGSIFMNKFVDKLKAPIVVFGVLELIVGIISIFNLYLIRPLDVGLVSRLSAPLVLVFPLTFIFGAIFPVASLCYVKSTNETGSSVGTLYSFNTIGNIMGSLLTGFLLIALIGSSNTIILLAFVNIALGLILLWSEPHRSIGFRSKYLLTVPIAILLSLGFRGKDPFLDVIEKRIKMGTKNYSIFLNKETVEGTVTSFIQDSYKGLLINGVSMTFLCIETKLMAHLPIALAEKPKNILVICFGMGNTVKSACVYDDLKITSVELVPEVYKCFKYYHDDAEEILRRENLNLVVEDGRNFLLLSEDKYDVITIDPSPPIHSAGAVNLYTKEFLSICRRKLTPEGIICLWVPRTIDAETIHILKTFHLVFPEMSLWTGPHRWGLYMIGTLKETSIDNLKLQNAFRNPKLLKDLKEHYDFDKSDTMSVGLLTNKTKNIEKITKRAKIITDNFPYTEFPLWRNLFRKLRNKRER